ncbi:MAG: phospholipase D-like domain-containing protein [Caulobacteraceae bacterium]
MSFLEPGETCWRIEAAGRLAFLIDYQSYFSALEAALKVARRQILLIGWSFDPRTRLAPDGLVRSGAPDEIGRRLIEVCAQRPALDVRVLIWRSALAISATQGFFPHRAKDWFKGTGVAFALDDTVPFGACHHQKVVVIDDEVAFCSSGDLCGDRWDTPAHLDRDTRRLSPGGRLHAPRHELSIIAEGPIAAAMGDLARERWRLAGGEKVAPPSGPVADPWPRGLAADIDGAQVAIARTLPAWRGCAGVHEIARLTVAAIAGARRRLYMENQYFTSPLVAEALAARLTDPQGPEVVLITTHRSVSYFDRLTMDRTRAIFIWRLLAADVFGRLRIMAPFTGEGRPIIVHAKAMIVDDALVRIGSANLNNRSQGFDTECELALEAANEDQRRAIETLADRLLGHWLGRDAADVARARERRGGLIAALDELNHGQRLRRIEPAKLGPLGAFIAEFHLGDPVSVADSWAIRRRRDRLYRQVRELENAPADSTPGATSKSTTSGR